MTETVTIIGAGIGGLTTAITLKQRGLNIALYEGSDEIKPVGAGILLAHNAMQVFHKMKLHDKIEKAGNKIVSLRITDPHFKNISITNLTGFDKKYGVSSIAIHRGELQRVLANEVGFENIHLSKRLTKAEKGELFQLTFEDKSTLHSKILIGADGIKSVVRNDLFEKGTLRNAGQLCWRGVCEMDLPLKYHNEALEALGKGRRFGFVKISDKKIYWYAAINKTSKDIHGSLAEIFKDFHPDILNIIASTRKDQIIENDLIDLKHISKWSDKNSCLIGDAAHATTPNMGQGACQAIEDAYIIGKLLDEGFSIENSFKEYEKLRRKKVTMIVNNSWRLGKLTLIENTPGVWLRNNLLRCVPEFVTQKQFDTLFRLH